LMRYLVGTTIAERMGSRFPLGTVVVNVSGCFLIGLIMEVLVTRATANPNWRAVLVVGFLGGYTTFSSFQWETFSEVRSGGFWIGVANVMGSVLLGYLAVWIGATLARH
jgi:fluoride exporter